MLVTAFTHVAIEILLLKIAPLSPSLTPPAIPLHIGKAKDRTGTPSADIENVPDRGISGWLAGASLAVVDATVYSCLKEKDAFAGRLDLGA